MILKKIINRNQFVKNVITVAGGTAGAQLITLMLTPVVTRIYSPESFGILGTFMAILLVLAPVSALTFPVAIVLAKNDREATGLITLSIWMASIISATLFAFLALYSAEVSVALKLESVERMLFVIPVLVLVFGFNQVAYQWLIRRGAFSLIARAAFMQSCFLNSLKIFLGYYHPSGVSLIISTTLGNTFHSLVLVLGLDRAKFFSAFKKRRLFSLAYLKRLGFKYKDFAVYRAPQAFLNPLSQSIPVVLLASYFGSASVGFYALARSVMAAPSLLLSKSVGDVFYPRIAEAKRAEKAIAPLLIKSTSILGLIGLFPFGLVMAFGPWAFELLFGDEWRKAGDYASWLALWLFFMFINVPCNVSLPVLSLLRVNLIFEVINIVVRSIAIGLGFYLYQSDYVSIALFCICGAFLNITLIFLVILKAWKLDKELSWGG